MPDKHKRLSASAAHRWIACPGSIRLAEAHGIKDRPSKYAAEGTAAHALAEKCLFFEAKAADFIGREVEGFVVTEEMAEAVQTYLYFVEGVVANGGVLKVETFLDLEHTGGTADCIVHRPDGDVLIVADYKHGRGVVVNPKHNPQLMIYALGALHLYPSTKRVRLVVVQPRAPGDPVRDWWTTPDELRAWRQEVLSPAMKAVDEDPMRFNPGEHCRFCPAAGVCKAAVQEACEVAKVEFGVAPEFPAPEKLTPEEIGKVLTFSARLTAWVDAVKDYAQGQMEQGVRVPGWKLVEGRSKREWTEGADGEIEKLLGDDAYERKLLTPAKAERVLKRKGLDGNALAQFVRKIPGGLVLAPQSDKRKEVVVDAASEFVESLGMFE